MKTKKEHLIELEEDLAPWLPREDQMGRILSGAATASMKFDREIEDVDNGLNIRTASTKEEVKKASQEINIEPKEGETLEKFKKRAIQQYNSLTLDGSPEAMLEGVSNLFDTDQENIEILNRSGEPTFDLRLDTGKLDTEFGNINETLKIALGLTASNYSINFYRLGTLEYITKEERNNDNFDTSYGYAKLDSNDNVTSGGTYSGY